jgi:type II secretory pathway component PulF
MTKINKVWLWVWLGLFAIPEILWSPISNFYFELSQTSKSGGTSPYRDNFLQNSDNLSWLKLVILLQFVGFLLFFYAFIQNRNAVTNPVIRWLLILVFLGILILSAFAAYFAYTFRIEIL